MDDQEISKKSALKTHFKKNWKKYILGASIGAVGVGAGVLGKKYLDAKKNTPSTTVSPIDSFISRAKDKIKDQTTKIKKSVREMGDRVKSESQQTQPKTDTEPESSLITTIKNKSKDQISKFGDRVVEKRKKQRAMWDRVKAEVKEERKLEREEKRKLERELEYQKRLARYQNEDLVARQKKQTQQQERQRQRQEEQKKRREQAEQERLRRKQKREEIAKTRQETKPKSTDSTSSQPQQDATEKSSSTSILDRLRGIYKDEFTNRPGD